MENSKDINMVIGSVDDKDAKVKIIKDKCRYLYRMGKPFTLVKSGSTYELISTLWNEKAFRKGFTTSDLTFIQSVRRYVDNNSIATKFIDIDYKDAAIDYIKVNNFKDGDRIEDLIYIDVNGAYWQTARSLGIIDDKIYKKGLDMDKVVRLAALGSLAKTKDVWNFDGTKLKKSNVIRSYETENLWFAICKRVSDMMVAVSKKIGSDFIFYWVDGIYIKNNNKSFQSVCKTFIDYGYTSKFEMVPYIEFGKIGFKVQGAIDGDVKEFSYNVEGKKGKHKSKPITEYIENKRLLKIARDIMYKKPKK